MFPPEERNKASDCGSDCDVGTSASGAGQGDTTGGKASEGQTASGPKWYSGLCTPAIGCDGQVIVESDRAVKTMRTRCNFDNEIRFLSALSGSECVVRLLESDSARMSLTMPAYCMDLAGRLISVHEAVSAQESRHVAVSLQRALGHCHACGVVHGDVKSENVLLPFPGGGSAVLCDFSRAYALHPKSPLLSMSLRKFGGTYAYASPESLQGHAGPPTDSWGLGVVVYCVVERITPFNLVPHPSISDVEIPEFARAVSLDANAWSAHDPRLCEWVQATLRRDWRNRSLPVDLMAPLVKALRSYPEPSLATSAPREASPRDGRPMI